jgi:hypothetical protein
MRLKLLIFLEVLSISQAQATLKLLKIFDRFHNDSSTACFQDLNVLNQERLDGAEWAKESEYLWETVQSLNIMISVLASWSETPDVIEVGNTFDFGDFNQCLKVHLNTDRSNKIKAQHCMYQFHSKSQPPIPREPEHSLFNSGWKQLNTRFGGAACLPASCSPEEVQEVLSFALSQTNFELASDYNQADYCKSESSETATNFSNWAIIMIAVLLVIAVSSTTLDFLSIRSHSQTNEWIMAFSLIRNVSILLSLSESKDEVKSIRAVRVILILGSISVHSCSYSTFFPMNNYPDFDYGINVVASYLLTYFVGGFFVISGFLATRNIVSLLKT